MTAMGLLARLTGQMSRSDARAWAQPTTLRELGELTARWLEGDIASQPGYQAGCGPDPETADLIPVLTQLNRAGFVTDASQPGIDAETGFDGATWAQRAAVSGFADDNTLAWLQRAVAGTRYELIATKAGRFRAADGIDVTTRNGDPYTVFGRRLPKSEISRQFHTCNRVMQGVLHAAWQVTIVDPHFGANDMWLDLHAAALSDA